MNRRIVIDTSTLVSAALRIGSPPHQALLQGLATCDLCASAETIAELERVLSRRKFDVYLERVARSEFVSLIRRHAQLYSVSEADLTSVKPSCRDSNDNHFLALAQIAGASAIISSDEDLLVLNPWRGIDILTAAKFLARAISL